MRRDARRMGWVRTAPNHLRAINAVAAADALVADELPAHKLAAHNKTGSLGYPLFACIRDTRQ
ncbi:hypothetical protein NCPPB940_09770 [Xanthomonas hortorum pv. taraxaci]|nr:hypothetical protein NCPPB940_09770 [Xanthomonas hortorum pv. taraxaci]CAD0309996.1 hypothetical protein NCPPB940_09770 [Xanthomonas hortorum pv. taraxaci]